MAFVNERITSENQERYRIPEIKRYIGTGYCSPITCTIDHERNMYLLHVDNQHGVDHQTTNLSGWVLVWNNEFIWTEIELLETKWKNADSLWQRKRIVQIGLMEKPSLFNKKGNFLPIRLNDNKEKILKDIYDALQVYQVSGISSPVKNFELQLEFGEGV
jgi:hypothetical protein